MRVGHSANLHLLRESEGFGLGSTLNGDQPQLHMYVWGSMDLSPVIPRELRASCAVPDVEELSKSVLFCRGQSKSYENYQVQGTTEAEPVM